jgi:hypothetical protein
MVSIDDLIERYGPPVKRTADTISADRPPLGRSLGLAVRRRASPAEQLVAGDVDRRDHG